jgi:hypothetical protein
MHMLIVALYSVWMATSSPNMTLSCMGEVGAKSHDIHVMHKMPTPKQQFPLPVMHLGLYRSTLPSKSGFNTSG